jgi:hypothetical protein
MLACASNLAKWRGLQICVFVCLCQGAPGFEPVAAIRGPQPRNAPRAPAGVFVKLKVKYVANQLSLGAH